MHFGRDLAAVYQMLRYLADLTGTNPYRTEPQQARLQREETALLLCLLLSLGGRLERLIARGLDKRIRREARRFLAESRRFMGRFEHHRLGERPEWREMNEPVVVLLRVVTPRIPPKRRILFPPGDRRARLAKEPRLKVIRI